MSTEQNKALIRRSVDEFWNTGNLGAIDELYTPGFVSHDPNGLHDGDLAAFRQSAGMICAAFPDLALTIEDLIAEGDRVVKRWTARCTHQGEFMGIPPTGNKMEITGTSTYRVERGKFAECWWNTDSLTMMQQLGVIPPMG